MVQGRRVRQVLMGFVMLASILVGSAPSLATEEPNEVSPFASLAFECVPRHSLYVVPLDIQTGPDPCVDLIRPPEPPVFFRDTDDMPEAPEWYCEPEAKEGIKRFRRILTDTYGISGQIERECDASWGYEFSFHKMGLALDWGVDVSDPHEWATGLSLIRWLLATDAYGNEFATARRVGVTQLIWNNRIWTAANPTWRVYCQTDACREDRTLRHEDHMHISFSLEAGYLHTSYFTALGFEPLPIPEPPEEVIVVEPPEGDIGSDPDEPTTLP